MLTTIREAVCVKQLLGKLSARNPSTREAFLVLTTIREAVCVKQLLGKLSARNNY